MNKEEKKPLVLIVEDDKAVNKLFEFYLRSEFNGTILSAYDGVSGVEKCLKYQPDVVFMDIKMPFKDGITAIQELRDAGFQNPIFVFTAYNDTLTERSLEAGANVVIPKPVWRDEFLKQFRRFYKVDEKLSIVLTE